MALREFLMIHEESSYGTVTLTGGAPTTNRYMYIRLDESNAFSMRPSPQFFRIMHGGGVNIAALTGFGSLAVTGQLRLKLCYSQFSRLMKWGVTRINSGRTTPWTTTDASNLMPPGDLASCSVYHAIQLNDGTYKRRRYSGTKVTGWNFSCNKDAQGQVAVLALDLAAIKPIGNAIDASSDPDATEFPAPADSDFPTDPILFTHSSTGLKIGSTRTLYESFSVSGKNTMGMGFQEKRYLDYICFTGRETTFEAKGVYKASPNDRAALEAVTVQDCQAVFTNGTNTATIDFQGANYFDGVGDDLPMEDKYKQALTLRNYYDTAIGGDQPDVAVSYS